MSHHLAGVGKPYQWKPGQSGNLNGKPVGARTAFSQGFLRDLAQVWQEHGRDTMLHTAKTQPATFFAVCARLIGPEVKVTIEQSLPGNLSPSDWADLRELLSAIQQGMPDAANRPPGEVFRRVHDALGKPEGNSVAEIEPAGI
jgi:hypothetical protein